MRLRRDESMEKRFMTAGTVERRAERRAVPRVVRFLGTGLLRLFAYMAVAVALAGGAGLAWGLISGSDDLVRSFTLGLYFGGAAMIGLGLLSAGRPIEYRGKLGESLGPGGGAGTGVIVLVGVIVVLLGVAVETVLRA
jgi:hypothetical protein